MELINANDVYEIQIDVTSYCNSFCGSCIRNIKGGPVNPLMKLQHMPWDMWKKISNYTKKNNVHLLNFNGNYGDFTSHPNIIEMLEYLYSCNSTIKLSIHTNGGARNESFWKSLAVITNKFPDSQVVFSIDGLEDTNHIYRRGVDFNKVIENAKIFIHAGGAARWRMIVFDHNKHQLGEARDMARSLGFWAFALNRSHATELPMDDYKEFPQGIITAPTGKEVDLMRKDFEFVNNGIKIEQRTGLTKLNSLCPWQQVKRLQINMIGEVWPCCYLSFHSGTSERQRFKYLDEKINEYGNNFNNLTDFELEDIINHKFFQEDLPYAWQNSLLGICKQKCGV